MAAGVVLLGESRDEGGRWLYERSDGLKQVYFRRRLGQSRQEITRAEAEAALAPATTGPDLSRPEPAGTYERPNYGPGARR